MSAKHIWAITLPGCGQVGGCDWATNGPYSKVLGLPVAFLGVGYFVGLLVTLMLVRHLVQDSRFKWFTLTGIIASLAFITLMLQNGRFCVWCAATHLSNVVFWLIVAVESSRAKYQKSNIGWRKPLLGLLAGFVALGLCWYADLDAKAKAEAENHRKGMESVEKIGADTSQPGAQPDATSATRPSTTVNLAGQDHKKTVARAPVRFGGRYWEGNFDAPVRIVMFHDYACELCFKAEGQIAALLASRNDVAFSVKQWPFDVDCNRFIIGKSLHPGACRASRAAEAAGLIGSDRGFWAMHHWLVYKGGQFTDDELVQQARSIGLDPNVLLQTIQSPQVDSMVRADVEEGIACGLTFTPMIFVNGYEVQGWQSAEVLPAAIQRAAEMAKARPRQDDRPDQAVDLQFTQWSALVSAIMPIRSNEQMQGPADGAATIVIYGDLTCAFHASAYLSLDSLLHKYSGIRYVFRDFPLDSVCNDQLTKQINPNACQVSRWAMAVRMLNGDTAYWKAHDWIVSHRNNPNLLTAAEIAKVNGTDLAALERLASFPQIQSQLNDDLALAKHYGVNTSPTIFVNGKLVQGWRTPGLLERVVASALQTGQQ